MMLTNDTSNIMCKCLLVILIFFSVESVNEVYCVNNENCVGEKLIMEKMINISHAFESKKYEKTIELATSLLTYEDLDTMSHIYALNYLIKAHYSLKNYSECFENINLSLEIDSTNAIGYLYLGIIYKDFGEYTKSQLNFRKAIDNYKDKAYFMHYFNFYLEQGLLIPLNLLNEAIEWDSMFLEARFFRIRDYSNYFDTNTQVKELNDIVDNSSIFYYKEFRPMVYFMLTIKYLEQEDYDSALLVCNKSIESNMLNNAKLFFERALINIYKKKYQEAVSDLKIFLDFGETYVNKNTTRLLLSYTFFLHNQDEESASYFRNFLVYDGEINIIEEDKCNFMIFEEDLVSKLKDFYYSKIDTYK